MISDRSRTIRALVFFGSACLSLAAVIAFPPPPIVDGWKYGGTFCGPYPGPTTLAKCNACCNAAATAGTIALPELARCLAFCAQANFNPPGQ